MTHNQAAVGLGRVLGLGHDLVSIADFEGQLEEPGSQLRRLFSARELRQSAQLALAKHDSEALHLAARWAGKESALKAWSAALASSPNPYTIESFPYPEVEVIDDSRGRPSLYLSDSVQTQLVQSLGLKNPPDWLVSLTHDGPTASAVVLLGIR